MVILKITYFMEKEFYIQVIVIGIGESFTKGVQMGNVILNGVMVIYLMAILKITLLMDTALLNIIMDLIMKEIFYKV